MNGAAAARDLQLRTHEARVAKMFADPRLGGELLIVGLAMASAIDLGGDKPAKLPAVARIAYPCPPHAHGPAWEVTALRKVQQVLAIDTPRYEAPPASGRCTAPGTGRNTLCDQPASGPGVTLVDLETGELSHLQACRRYAHRTWMNDAATANHAELVAAGGAPAPAANAGGVLAAHLPEVPWLLVWSAVRPGWTPPPAAEEPAPTKRARTIQRGHLRLV